MTDLAAPGGRIEFGSAAARTRLARRYRTEARFKSYGIIGLAIAALFLVVLFANILSQGLPAFWQHALRIEVALPRDAVDPQGAGDPAELAKADYQKLVRDALLAKLSFVTSRADRKLLTGLLSSGAGDALRREVVAHPGLVGQTVTTDALLSDEADLYLKGHETSISTLAPVGRLALAIEAATYVMNSTANDFAPVLAKVKEARLARAQAFEIEAQRLRTPLAGLGERVTEAATALASARAGQDADAIAAAEARATKTQADYTSLEQKAVALEEQARSLRASASSSAGNEVLDDDAVSVLIAVDGGVIKITELGETLARGEALIPPASAAPADAGAWRILTYDTPAADRRTGDKEIAWLEKLRDEGAVSSNFNWLFFTAGDSREPELAGIRGALVGSLLTLFVTLVLCLPLGVGAAIYLEEFAQKNRLTEFIEVNINNLAAVPSIVFGLLGLAMFLNAFGLPRSAALVGGLVLALLVLPTIIIAARAALKAVPPSIKEAALGVGASHQQAVFHHVLPLALPGIMTGTIIGMAHALGETAPLLMIGMVAFIVDVPGGFTDAATALPVQIFLWSDLPEIAFQAKTAAAIIVLLAFLFIMNGAAIVLRSRFQRRW